MNGDCEKNGLSRQFCTRKSVRRALHCQLKLRQNNLGKGDTAVNQLYLKELAFSIRLSMRILISDYDFAICHEILTFLCFSIFSPQYHSTV